MHNADVTWSRFVSSIRSGTQWSQVSQVASHELLETMNCVVVLQVLPSATVAEPQAKKPRLDDKAGKIRCRHIVLKHIGCKPAVDPLRRKPVTRTMEEAELALLEVLPRLMRDPTREFPALARELSECQSAMKGGAEAGDMGWVRKGSSSKQFDAVAFNLKVGQVSDVVAADSGVHIIQRLA
mmetsp:Transcript_76489/g.175319  ORF Transcript_76489/g.175319 Transcript_76489/m.175319 type:complete len:182 (+) Transcript_76489:1435-1980(+)